MLFAQTYLCHYLEFFRVIEIQLKLTVLPPVYLGNIVSIYRWLENKFLTSPLWTRITLPSNDLHCLLATDIDMLLGFFEHDAFGLHLKMKIFNYHN